MEDRDESSNCDEEITATQPKKKKNKTPRSVLEKNKRYYLEHKDKIREYRKSYNIRNAKKRAEYNKQYAKENRENRRLYERVYWKKNKDRKAAKEARSYQKNKAKIQSKRAARLRSNLQARMAVTLRSRLGCAIKSNQKGGSAIRDLGCSIEFFIDYISSLFSPGMTWDNWGRNGWHLDHKIPLISFDLSDPDEIKKACHYSNIQPLWSQDNIRKSAKLV